MLPHPEGIERGCSRSPKPPPVIRALLGHPPRLLAAVYPQILSKSPEIFIEVFRARGLPLEAAGVTTGLHRHTAWSIFADQNRLGSLAAELLLRRIRVPTSDFLREGMAMVFPKYMQHTSLQMTEN